MSKPKKTAATAINTSTPDTVETVRAYIAACAMPRPELIAWADGDDHDRAELRRITFAYMCRCGKCHVCKW